MPLAVSGPRLFTRAVKDTRFLATDIPVLGEVEARIAAQVSVD
jgi:hypothetical protein